MSNYPDGMSGSDWCHVEGCDFRDGNTCSNCGRRISPRCFVCGRFVKITQSVCNDPFCIRAEEHYIAQAEREPA